MQVELNKNPGNIRIYHTHVFCVRSGPNQKYSPKYAWERLSPSSMRKVKGRTLESEYFKAKSNNDRTQFSPIVRLRLITSIHKTRNIYVESRKENI